ncbi:MAG: tetratricopeptide repeat protein [Cyanobacteriota bacterium]|nr:tetratricopeptide repeat protein [Cyanobacteriota bacterium]
MNQQRWQQLNSQVEELYNRGKFREGITIAEEALDLARSLWGKSHLNFAISTNNLGGSPPGTGRKQSLPPSDRHRLSGGNRRQNLRSKTISAQRK